MSYATLITAMAMCTHMLAPTAVGVLA